MNLENLKPGDMIYAATDVFNDGSLPGVETDARIAVAGARGVLINTGHLEESPETLLYLVRFEDANMELGPAVACFADEVCPEPMNH
jgi:nitrogen fixation protein NifZ